MPAARGDRPGGGDSHAGAPRGGAARDGAGLTDSQVAGLNRAAYDRIAADYAERTSDRRGDFFGALRRRFTAAVPKGGVVLDVGCGPGHLLPVFAAAWLRPVGVDPSAAMRSIAAGTAVPVVGAEMAALPFGDSCVDGIWCQASLLHVPELATAQVLAGFARVLRPGGQLGLVTAVGSGTRLEEVDGRPGVFRCFTYRDPADLRSLLTGTGFAVRAEERTESRRSWYGVHADLAA